MKTGQIWTAVTVAAIAAWAWLGLGADLSRIDRAPSALGQLMRDAIPPDFSNFSLIWAALVETLQIAVLATLFGTILALPIGILAARNLFPVQVAASVRTVANAVRVLPSILWALVAVLIFGPGPLAGVVAMTFYTIGYLAKLQSEAFEGIPRDALDAVRAMGLGRGTVAWHVALPEAANALRSQVLFMLEYNVRNSSVVGLVGAGGMGILLFNAYSFFDYDRLAALLLVMFGTVVILDAVSFGLRRRFVEMESARRPKWRDVLMPWKTTP
jgi:phosphonate transport system permease protein